MNFEELKNKVKLFTNDEESSFTFTPSIVGNDISQGVFSELLNGELVVKPMSIIVEPTESYIQVEGTSNINSINVNSLIEFSIVNEEVKYHCIVRFPEDWLYDKVPQLKKILNDLGSMSGIGYSIHNPGFVLSTGGPIHKNIQEINGLPLNFQGCMLFSEIEFTGGVIDTLRGVLNIPNTMKLVIKYNTGNISLVKAIYDVPSTQGSIKFDGIEIYFTMSQFELSCNMQIDIGRDTLLFQTGVNFLEQGSMGLVFRLTGVWNSAHQLSKDWINPLGIPLITISDLAASYAVDPKGFIINLSGTIKSGESPDDQIVLNVEELELVNGTLPTAFVGRLHHSSGNDITMTKLIDSFFRRIILKWPDSGNIVNLAPLLDEIKVRDFEIYFILGPTPVQSPKNSSITFPPGLGMYVDGSLATFDVKMHTYLKGDLNFAISGEMEKLNFCNGMIVLEDSSSSDKGPSFTYQSESGNYVLNIDIGLTMFGSPKITVNASRNQDGNITFSPNDKIFQKEWGTRSCRCELINSNQISVNLDGAFRFDEKIISIKILDFGTCTFNVYLYCIFNVSLNVSVNDCHTNFKVNISVLNETFNLSVNTDTVFTTLEQIEKVIINEVLDEIRNHFKDIKIETLLDLFNGNLLYFVNPIGQVLKDLGVTTQLAVELLTKLERYKDKSEDIAKVLISGGYTVEELKKINVPNFTIPPEWSPGNIDLGHINVGNLKPPSWPK